LINFGVTLELEAALSETFDVFFSYNHKDLDAVRRIAAEMRRQGLRVWMDEEDLPLGQPWQPHVEEALKSVRSAKRCIRRPLPPDTGAGRTTPASPGIEITWLPSVVPTGHGKNELQSRSGQASVAR